MSEVDVLEQELRSLGSAVNTRTIEIKARMKKAISNPKVSFISLVDNLQKTNHSIISLLSTI